MAGWVEMCKADDIEEEDVIRFDHGGGLTRSIDRRTMNTSRPTDFARMSRSTSPAGW